MKNILVSFIFLSYFVSLGAQTMVLNQVKYWDYRKALKEKYIDIGEGQGKSIPAEYIDENRNKVHWGDGNMALGWYIGLLATEYHLSAKQAYIETGEDKAIDSRQTLIELSYALQAVDRLDLAAEPFFKKGAPPVLNGFLLRDDVGEPTKDKWRAKYRDISSDYMEGNPLSNEMSQDQTYELFIGLSLVKNYIPEETQVSGQFLNRMAVDQAKRVLAQLQKTNWRLRNPVIKSENGKKGKTVMRGHQSYIFSQGISKIGRLFQNKKIKNPWIYDFFWSSLRMGVNPLYAENSNSSMVFAIAAVGNGFEKNTYRKLTKRARKNDWYFYPLLNRSIYPTNRLIKDDVLTLSKKMIDEAPANGIKSNFNRSVNHSWGVNNKFYKFKQYQRNGKDFQENREFNGLDFMLFYNLWLINKTGEFKDSWKLLGPQTRKEKRKVKKEKKRLEKEETTQ